MAINKEKLFKIHCYTSKFSQLTGINLKDYVEDQTAVPLNLTKLCIDCIGNNDAKEFIDYIEGLGGDEAVSIIKEIIII